MVTHTLNRRPSSDSNTNIDVHVPEDSSSYTKHSRTYYILQGITDIKPDIRHLYAIMTDQQMEFLCSIFDDDDFQQTESETYSLFTDIFKPTDIISIHTSCIIHKMVRGIKFSPNDKEFINRHLKHTKILSNGSAETYYTPYTKKELSEIIRIAVNENTLGLDANLNWIDTSKITDMSDLFRNMYYYDGDFYIDDEDSSLHMFHGDISLWNVSNVSIMNRMFFGCHNLPKDFDISGWDTSKVTSMAAMFMGSSFNGDISRWDVHNVTSMTNTFSYSSFNGNISSWDVSNVTDMLGMFTQSDFNQDINEWDVRKVRCMRHMFSNSEFNKDLDQWEPLSATDMNAMFAGCVIDSKIGIWNLNSVQNMSEMFREATVDSDIHEWQIPENCDITNMFTDCKIPKKFMPRHNA